MSACEHTRPVFGCDGCIAKANVGMDVAGGGKTFRVEVERIYACEFYVVAASKEQAEIDAEGIADTFRGSDLSLADENTMVWEADAPEGEEVWVGGAKGGWESPAKASA